MPFSSYFSAAVFCDVNVDAGFAQESFRNVEKALSLYPQHTESLEVLEMLKKKLAR